MSKVTLISIVLLSTAAYIGINKYSSQQKEDAIDSDMALSYLADRKGWVSQTDQLAAINKDLFVLESKIVDEVGDTFVSEGTIEDRSKGLCLNVRYQWHPDNRENPTFLFKKRCH